MPWLPRIRCFHTLYPMNPFNKIDPYVELGEEYYGLV